MTNYQFNPQPYEKELLAILQQVSEPDQWDKSDLRRILKKFPKDGNGLFSRNHLVLGYNYLISINKLKKDTNLLDRIKMKPTRTISGVVPITVLTKPFPCPGKCIYCPNDVRMPKSYLADEPGAQRAERNAFDPYLQTYNRLQALANIGHSTDKAELIILGGTWSFYPEAYQIWFIKRCFDALNDFGNQDKRDDVKTANIFEEAERIPKVTKEGRKRAYNEIVTEVARNNGEGFITQTERATWEDLFEVQKINELANSRCIGLVIETRPDYITSQEVIKIRKLGATKVQIGIQSLSDKVQSLNKRGHTTKETEIAFRLLRLAGFKIHGHWMPNQYGSSVKEDIADYRKLWKSEFCPDELKIYPTSIIPNTELNELYKKGEYQPYTYDELMQVLISAMPDTPRYCRLTRVIRDIPSIDIVAGNKLTNFRELVENQLIKQGTPCQCIRCREIKSQKVSAADLVFEKLIYKTTVATEYFLSYKTKNDDKIVGFLRLSFPLNPNSEEIVFEELRNSAIIREVHVYGQVVDLGKQDAGRSQHLGLGTQLLIKAEELAKEKKFNKISVISAIGTREYYKKRGYELNDLYMSKAL